MYGERIRTPPSPPALTPPIPGCAPACRCADDQFCFERQLKPVATAPAQLSQALREAFYVWDTEAGEIDNQEIVKILEKKRKGRMHKTFDRLLFGLMWRSGSGAVVQQNPGADAGGKKRAAAVGARDAERACTVCEHRVGG